MLGDDALCAGLGQLLIEKVIGEVDAIGVFGAVAVVDRLDACPVGCGPAHGAGFATGVEFAVTQIKRVEVAAGVAYRVYFGVRGGIVCCGDGVDAFTDDLAISYDDRAERASRIGADVFRCEGDGPPHEIFIQICCHTVQELQMLLKAVISMAWFIRDAAP